MLLGDVGQLEEERERPQDLRLLVEVELLDGTCQLVPHLWVAALAGPPGDAADLLLPRQQLLSLLLDHDAAEQIAEQANVPAERRVSRHDVRDYVP